jgi:hypothetical protein
LVFVPGCCIRLPARTGRGREDQAVAVSRHWKRHYATKVDPLNVHRRHVAQQIHFDTPRPSVMPRIQDPLEVLGHPPHDDVGQSGFPASMETCVALSCPEFCGPGMHRLLSEDSGKDSGQKLMDLCMREKSEQF